MLVRRANVDVNYKGVNVTSDVRSDGLSVTYSDEASDKADDISIDLADDSGRWIGAWSPFKGDDLSVSFRAVNWNAGSFLRCGSFSVDEVSYSGTPCKISIRGLNVPKNHSFTETEKSKTWEDVSLKRIAQDIAGGNGLSLHYGSSVDPPIKAVEQSQKSDSAFLLDQCKKYGFCMKAYSGSIVIFRESEY